MAALLIMKETDSGVESGNMRSLAWGRGGGGGVVTCHMSGYAHGPVSDKRHRKGVFFRRKASLTFYFHQKKVFFPHFPPHIRGTT